MPKRKLKPRKDGRYEAKIYLGLNEERKKKYLTVYGNTIAELEAKEREIRLKIQKGIDVLTLNDTYSQWLERLSHVKKTELTENEYNTFYSRAAYFNEFVGNTPIKDIAQQNIQPIINALFEHNPNTSKPSAKRTLQRYVSAMSAVFEFAIENRATDYNPCKYVKIPKQAQVSERRALSAQERKWIEDTPHPAQTAAMLMMYSGLRRGEATALLWSDIDLSNKLISVTKSYDFKQGTVKSPKTLSGTRTVAIPSKLSEYLATVKRTSIYVIPHPLTGGVMTDKQWKNLWNDYLISLNKKYGIEGEIGGNVTITINPFTPHCLRHTFCTIMYESGVDVLTAKEQLGHSDIRTTLAIYTHLDRQHKHKNISKLDEYLKASSD